MSSNQLSELDKKIALEVLQRIQKRKKIDSVHLFQKHFTPKPENQKKKKQEWNRTQHRLYQTFMRYFAMRLIEDHPMKSVLFTQFYNEHDLERPAQRLKTKEKNRLAELMDPNAVLYEYLLLEMTMKGKKILRKDDRELTLLEEKLDHFFVEKKLRFLCEKANRKRIINNPDEDNDALLLAWIEDYVRQFPSIKAVIYLDIFKMLSTSSSEVYYKKLYDKLPRHAQEIDRATLKEFYQYLLNYCISRVNHGKLEYANAYLSILDGLAERGLLHEDGKISVFSFKNHINISLIAGEHQRAEQFCDQYRKRLVAEGHQDVLRLSRAAILLLEEAYEACEALLGYFALDDPFHKLASEFLLLKITSAKVQAGKYDYDNFLTKLKSKKAFIRKQNWITEVRKEKLIYFLTLLPWVIKGKKIHNMEELKDKVYALDWLWLKKMNN
ncbi:MAG: hypothetical protein AAGG75_27450 [Bacteroidota bacterium]